ncbi:MAG: hypothetical protein ACI4I6_01130 [Hominimerdicola sp.]
MKYITSKYTFGERDKSVSPKSVTINEVKEAERNRKKTLIKLVASGILLAIMIVFGSVAWFTMNNVTETDKMTMVASGERFIISVLEDGNDGIYYNDYHKLVQDSSAVVWKMTDENNMDNYDSSGKGIHPGSCGVISFYVTPKVETVNLKFTFEVIGYVSKETGDESEKNVTMTPVEQGSALEKYLNGHILLFEERSGSSDAYKYSKPILSDEDMKRVIDSNTYSDNGTQQKVDIYWVWPNTLSNLVDARDCQKVVVTGEPFTTDDDYQRIVENITTYPYYYLKGFSFDQQPSQSEENESESGGQSSDITLTEDKLVTDYDKYGDMYDQADNDIGMGIDFILLKMSVAEADSVGE